MRPMYPPSDEPDSVRIARNKAQARWAGPILYVGFALIQFISGHTTLGVLWALTGVAHLALLLWKKRRDGASPETSKKLSNV